MILLDTWSFAAFYLCCCVLIIVAYAFDSNYYRRFFCGYILVIASITAIFFNLLVIIHYGWGVVGPCLAGTILSFMILIDGARDINSATERIRKTDQLGYRLSRSLIALLHRSISAAITAYNDWRESGAKRAQATAAARREAAREEKEAAQAQLALLQAQQSNLPKTKATTDDQAETVETELS